jgi:hypothetical protein
MNLIQYLRSIPEAREVRIIRPGHELEGDAVTITADDRQRMESRHLIEQLVREIIDNYDFSEFGFCDKDAVRDEIHSALDNLTVDVDIRP